MIKNCKNHGLVEHVPRANDKYWRCPKCSSESVTRRRKKMKVMLVEYKGGCCERCGYDKFIGALEFHHLDPAQKDLKVAGASQTRAYESLRKEVDKCMLVCSNCHREIHEEIRNMDE